MNRQKNKPEKKCPCPNSGCPRHGDCKKCAEYHAKNGGTSYCKR